MADESLSGHADALSAFLSETGLPSNGTINVHLGEDGAERTYALTSIAWRLLEDIGVGIAAYNTPKSLHCLSPQQQMETFLVLEHARRDPRVKALVWTGTGKRAFCSGAALKGDRSIHVAQDIVKAFKARGLAPTSDDMVLAKQTRAFWDFPKPIVMAVNGLAVGGGANIALVNFGDLVICSKTARFMYPFAKLGVTPELGSSFVLPWLVGMAKAKEMMMTGTWLGADEALRLNLVSQVCAPEELLPRAVALAAGMATVNPETMRLMKQVMNAPLREQLDSVLRREQQLFGEAVAASGGLQKNAKL